jgi:hydrogenase nickel incorporation protein HypA/HybF
MHEMSIAKSIVDIVAGESEKAGGGEVSEVELEIGTLAGIEYESLEFAIKALKPGSIIENSRVIIQKPQGEAVCMDCEKRFVTDSPVNSCPVCGSYGCSIVKGKELRVVSILIDK